MSTWVIFLAIIGLFDAGWIILAFVHFRCERRWSLLRAGFFSALAGAVTSFLGFFLSEMTLVSPRPVRIVFTLFWLACPYVSLAVWSFHRRHSRRQLGH
jgi:hypothetical protein